MQIGVFDTERVLPAFHGHVCLLRALVPAGFFFAGNSNVSILYKIGCEFFRQKRQIVSVQKEKNVLHDIHHHTAECDLQRTKMRVDGEDVDQLQSAEDVRSCKQTLRHQVRIKSVPVFPLGVSCWIVVQFFLLNLCRKKKICLGLINFPRHGLLTSFFVVTICCFHKKDIHCT